MTTQSKKNQADPVVIIGAGPAGLSAATELSKQGVPVEVHEKSLVVGGMAKSFPLW